MTDIGFPLSAQPRNHQISHQNKTTSPATYLLKKTDQPPHSTLPSIYFFSSPPFFPASTSTISPTNPTTSLNDANSSSIVIKSPPPTTPSFFPFSNNVSTSPSPSLLPPHQALNLLITSALFAWHLALRTALLSRHVIPSAAMRARHRLRSTVNSAVKSVPSTRILTGSGGPWCCGGQAQTP